MLLHGPAAEGLHCEGLDEVQVVLLHLSGGVGCLGTSRVRTLAVARASLALHLRLGQRGDCVLALPHLPSAPLRHARPVSVRCLRLCRATHVAPGQRTVPAGDVFVHVRDGRCDSLVLKLGEVARVRVRLVHWLLEHRTERLRVLHQAVGDGVRRWDPSVPQRVHRGLFAEKAALISTARVLAASMVGIAIMDIF